MTERPQNCCADCGYTWHPRGNDVSGLLSPVPFNGDARPAGCWKKLLLRARPRRQAGLPASCLVAAVGLGALTAVGLALGPCERLFRQVELGRRQGGSPAAGPDASRRQERRPEEGREERSQRQGRLPGKASAAPAAPAAAAALNCLLPQSRQRPHAPTSRARPGLQGRNSRASASASRGRRRCGRPRFTSSSGIARTIASTSFAASSAIEAVGSKAK